MQITQKTNLIYKVKSGDTISSIATLCKVEEEKLKELNNITEVYENQILTLPQKYKKVYVVKPLDSFENIAREMNISINELKEVLGDKKIFIGQKIII